MNRRERRAVWMAGGPKLKWGQRRPTRHIELPVLELWLVPEIASQLKRAFSVSQPTHMMIWPWKEPKT